MKIFVNAGHWDHDSGAVHDKYKESDLVISIRDVLKQIAPNLFYVPDDLDLRKSIEWVNERCSQEDIAIGLHLNANKNHNIRGTEAYYAHDDELAQVFARQVSQSLGIPNRGAKHDSETYVGSLGFLRKLNCRSVVVEIAYLTNNIDRNKITFPSGFTLSARGIKNAIDRFRGQASYILGLHMQITKLAQVVIDLLLKLIGLQNKNKLT